jgi:hypothetical protein
MAENSPVLESIHILNEPQVDNIHFFLLLAPQPFFNKSSVYLCAMALSGDNEVAIQFPFFNLFKDGRVELLWSDLFPKMPPSHDLITGVKSKDVIISTEPQVSTRIFLLELKTPDENSLSYFIFMGVAL